MLAEKYQEALLRDAGCHSETTAPTERDERLQFATLEAIDWNCPHYDWSCSGRGDGYDGLTTDMLEAAAKESHTNGIECEPPSFMGLLAGTFSFLDEEQPDA